MLEHIQETKSKMVLILDKLFEKYGGLVCDVPMVILPLGASAGGGAGLIMRLTTKQCTAHKSYEEFLEEGKNTNFLPVCKDNVDTLIIYTSGSTGTPKGVVLTSRNLNAIAIQCAISGKDYHAGEVFLNILPSFFSFGIGMLHLCLYTGMTEIPVLIPEVKVIQKMIKKYRPSRFVFGPALSEIIETYHGKDLSFLTDLTGGGAAISLEKERLINAVLQEKRASSKYLAGYGMTELASAVSMNHNDRCKEQSIGIPLPMTNVKIIDLESKQELGYDEEGELLVSTPAFMSHYFNNVEETNIAIEISDGERWMHTGDLAKIDKDGYVFITGRLKRIYTVKGEDHQVYKLFPQRMEEEIGKIGIVEKCAVIVVEDGLKGNAPIVFVTADAAVIHEELKKVVEQVVQKELPSYYAPKDVIVLDHIPITSSQKNDYQALKKCTSHNLVMKFKLCK